MSGSRRPIERLRKFIEFHLVCVALCRVRSRVTHQPLQSDEIAAALAKEPIREPVTKLMRGEAPHTGPLADAPKHPHQRLCARGLLRILAAANAVVLRNPLLNLDSEDMIVELGPQSPKQRPQLANDIRVKRKPLPVPALASHTRAPLYEVEVRPAARNHFGASQAGPFHQEDRSALMRKRRSPDARYLMAATAPAS